ncbi:MAG TPA: hypothetical protein VKG45_10765 [Actinomycetes bacterium]|nr:hypothetical protein [Actinomycetes bacterium]
MTREEKLTLARELTRLLLAEHGQDAILAVGLHGSVARGDDDGGSGLDLAVVTARADLAVPDRTLRHRGIVVDLGAITGEGYLAEAAQIGPAWPLAHDQYVHNLPLHDPTGFFPRLRETHEQAVRHAGDDAFAAAAGSTLAQALDHQARARRALAADDPALALFAVREAAVLAAMFLGLVARAAYRNLAHALQAAGTAPVPPGFGGTFRLAIAADSDAMLAVAALGEALDALGELARRDRIPFETDELDAFL